MADLTALKQFFGVKKTQKTSNIIKCGKENFLNILNNLKPSTEVYIETDEFPGIRFTLGRRDIEKESEQDTFDPYDIETYNKDII